MAEKTQQQSSSGKLEHTEGGVTTRDDALDAGVPMLPGQPDEPIGPEDAFGRGPKRGDYSDRIDSGPHLVTERIPDAKPGEPHTRLVNVSERAGERGDKPGKGGVSAA